MTLLIHPLINIISARVGRNTKAIQPYSLILKINTMERYFDFKIRLQEISKNPIFPLKKEEDLQPIKPIVRWSLILQKKTKLKPNFSLLKFPSRLLKKMKWAKIQSKLL